MDSMRSVGIHNLSSYTAAPPKLGKSNDAATVDTKDKVTVSSSSSDDNPGAIRKAFNSMVSGVGLGSGVIGGGLLGASVAGAKTLVAGLLAQNLTLAGITAAGMTGGIAGAVVFGIAGAYGGWKVAEGIGKGIKWVGNKIMQGKQFAELQKKEELLGQKEGELKQLSADLAKQTADAKVYHEKKSQDLDAREASMNDRDVKLKEKETNMDKIIQEKADKMYTDKSADLREWEAKLDKKEGELKAWEARLNEKEQKVDQHIEAGAQKLYNERKGVLEGEYQDRQSKLDRRESDLNNKERNIDGIIADRVEREVTPLKREWQTKLDDARRYEDQAAGKLRQADQELRRAEDLRNQANSEKQNATAEYQKYSRANAELEGERSRIESDKRRLMQKEADLNRWEQQLRDKEAQLHK